MSRFRLFFYCVFSAKKFYKPSKTWLEFLKSVVFSRDLRDFSLRDELCEDCEECAAYLGHFKMVKNEYVHNIQALQI